jgi:hypothetical protein
MQSGTLMIEVEHPSVCDDGKPPDRLITSWPGSRQVEIPKQR